MKGLLLIAHGSRLESSNAEVVQLGQKLQAASSQFQWLDIAFLELTTPTVSQQIDAAVNTGVTELTVFPYFLAAGSHVQKDLPELMTKARQQYPQVQFRLTAHLGAMDELVALILKHL